MIAVGLFRICILCNTSCIVLVSKNQNLDCLVDNISDVSGGGTWPIVS